MQKNGKAAVLRARTTLVLILIATLGLAALPHSTAANSAAALSINDTANHIIENNALPSFIQQRAAPIAGPGTQHNGGLSAEGIRQISALITEKQNRTPAEQKIDSQLLQAFRESRGQQMAPGVNLRPAQVRADAQGSLLVDIDAKVSDTLIVRIEALGGRMVYPSFKYNTIRARVNLSSVHAIAEMPEVKFVKPAVRIITHGLPAGASPAGVSPTGTSFAERAANVRKEMTASPAAGGFFTGSVDSQGDRTHRADDTRNTYGYSGFGIKIGVLSDSFNSLGGAPEDVLTGDLPGPGNPLGNLTPVTVISDLGPGVGTDEGRAILQIIHDLAPKAQLFFATVEDGEASFAQNILNLQSVSHCDIIMDDAGTLSEPVFEDGILAQAVDTVTAAGALYFSSAGNEGSLEKGTSGVFEGDFNDAGSPAFMFPGGAKTGTIHNFGTMASPVSADTITSVGGGYVLQWADPQGQAADDYDLFLVDTDGSVVASSTNIQNGSQNPFEGIGSLPTDAGLQLAVFKTTGSASVGFHLNTAGGTLADATTGQTHGHSAAGNIGVFSVGATPAGEPFTPGYPMGPFPNAFSAADKVENFSSDGPRRVFFNADGSPITPGNLTFGANGGQVRAKPDITAADGVSTTINTGELRAFFGTSAAAPHAAAIAALLKSAKPTLTQAQMRTILTTTALDIEAPGYDNVSGFGILQAFQAMQAVSPTPEADVNLNSFSITEGELSNHNGVVEAGESANVVANLIDPSLVTTPGVTATLSAVTSGVTVLRNVATYGTLTSDATASNSANPFIIKLDPSLACGTPIQLALSASFSGSNSPQIFLLNSVVGTPPINISASLGSPATGASFTSTTGTQTDRIFRTGIPSFCDAPKTNPASVASGPLTYDAYTFTNSSLVSQCVTVTMSLVANYQNIFTVAYDNGGFVPNNVTANYLADSGASIEINKFSFTAPAGQKFTVVVDDATGTSVGTAYSLNVTLALCSAAAATCPTITISPTSIPQPIAGVPYSQTFSVSGGMPAYMLALTGTLPAGLTLNGLTISGTPATSGAISIMLTATDLVGCQSTSTAVASTVLLSKCLRDDHTGDFILLNPTTGNYEFVHCGVGASEVIVSGKGTVTNPSGMVTITDKESTRTVTISYNPGSLTGTAIVTLMPSPGISQTYRINDTNPSAVCACGG
jgi:hypothetical protein